MMKFVQFVCFLLVLAECKNKDYEDYEEYDTKSGGSSEVSNEIRLSSAQLETLIEEAAKEEVGMVKFRHPELLPQGPPGDPGIPGIDGSCQDCGPSPPPPVSNLTSRQWYRLVGDDVYNDNRMRIWLFGRGRCHDIPMEAATVYSRAHFDELKASVDRMDLNGWPVFIGATKTHYPSGRLTWFDTGEPCNPSIMEFHPYSDHEGSCVGNTNDLCFTFLYEGRLGFKNDTIMHHFMCSAPV